MAKIAKKNTAAFKWSTLNLERARDDLVKSAKHMRVQMILGNSAQDQVLIDLSIILKAAKAETLKTKPDAKYVERGVIDACREIVQTQCPELSEPMLRKMILVAKNEVFQSLFGISNRRKSLKTYQKRLRSLCNIESNGSKTLLGYGRTCPDILDENKTKTTPPNKKKGQSNTGNKVVSASERATIKTPTKEARKLVDSLREPLAAYCVLQDIKIEDLEEVLLKVAEIIDDKMVMAPRPVISKAK